MFNLVNRARKRNNKGFSLVELIVVVLIIAIIAVALAPQVMKYVGSARIGTDANNIANIKSAVQAAVADFSEKNDVATGEGTYVLTAGKTGDEGKAAGTKSGSGTDAGVAALATCIDNITGKDIPKINESGKTKYQAVVSSTGAVTVTVIA